MTAGAVVESLPNGEDEVEKLRLLLEDFKSDPTGFVDEYERSFDKFWGEEFQIETNNLSIYLLRFRILFVFVCKQILHECGNGPLRDMSRQSINMKIENVIEKGLKNVFNPISEA